MPTSLAQFPTTRVPEPEADRGRGEVVQMELDLDDGPRFPNSQDILIKLLLLYILPLERPTGRPRARQGPIPAREPASRPPRE